MERDTNGLTWRRNRPSCALGRCPGSYICLVTGGTSLEWPYHTLLVVSSVIGLNDESVANVWKELHGHQSNALTLMLGIWDIRGRGEN